CRPLEISKQEHRRGRARPIDLIVRYGPRPSVCSLTAPQRPGSLRCIDSITSNVENFSGGRNAESCDFTTNCSNGIGCRLDRHPHFFSCRGRRKRHEETCAKLHHFTGVLRHIYHWHLLIANVLK